MDLERIKGVALEAAEGAGRLLKENLGRANAVEFKGEIDLVTEMDRKAEELIVGRLSSAFPDHSIIAEEREGVEKASPYRWIVDPLDGTTNYAHGYPVFCVSIAFEAEGDLVFGVVYNPVLEETFLAERGGGATLNGRPIHVSGTERLERSLLATGFPYDIRRTRDNNLNHFCSFAIKAQAIRRAGSAALDLCYVACGRFDGYWELRLKPWDVAAGSLMVREAGGMVTTFDGGPFDIYSTNIVASNGKIHSEMLEVLRE